MKAFERGAIADVGLDAKCLAAAGFKRDGSLFHLLLAAGCGDHVSAGVGQAEAERAADAGCSAGDDGDFPFKAH